MLYFRSLNPFFIRSMAATSTVSDGTSPIMSKSLLHKVHGRDGTQKHIHLKQRLNPFFIRSMAATTWIKIDHRFRVKSKSLLHKVHGRDAMLLRAQSGETV